MKLKLPILLALVFTIVLTSCSSDDDNTISDENTKEFTFNGETYDLVTAIISSDDTSTNDGSKIGIRLFNKTSSEITSNSDLDDITFVYFELEAVNLEATTYTEIDYYDVSINGSVVDSAFNAGTILLSADDSESDIFAQSASVTIRNFTAFNIDFTFTFTRNDGQVISGRYNGNYLLPD
jgi:hypothetical protein